MALVEDVLKGNLAAAAAIGATALVLPKVLPHLSPPVRGIVKSGVSLFLDSEFDAENSIIGRLAENALKDALKKSAGPGPSHERRKAAHGVIESFKRTAHARAQRYGHDEKNRKARYSRHLAALRHSIDREQSRRGGADRAALHDFSALLAET
jgi:hypothetical protein